jgi:hypothetical protein
VRGDHQEHGQMTDGQEPSAGAGRVTARPWAVIRPVLRAVGSVIVLWLSTTCCRWTSRPSRRPQLSWSPGYRSLACGMVRALARRSQ